MTFDPKPILLPSAESLATAIQQAKEKGMQFQERLKGSFFAQSIPEYKEEFDRLATSLDFVANYKPPRVVSMQEGVTLSDHWTHISNALNAINNQLTVDASRASHIDHTGSDEIRQQEVDYNKNVDEFKDSLTWMLYHEIKPNTDVVLNYLNYHLQRPQRGEGQGVK